MEPPPQGPRRCENPRVRMVTTVWRAIGDGPKANGVLALTLRQTTDTCAEATNAHGPGPGETQRACLEARSVARQLSDPKSKQMMFSIAADYDRLAEHAQRRAAKRPAQ